MEIRNLYVKSRVKLTVRHVRNGLKLSNSQLIRKKWGKTYGPGCPKDTATLRVKFALPGVPERFAAASLWAESSEPEKCASGRQNRANRQSAKHPGLSFDRTSEVAPGSSLWADSAGGIAGKAHNAQARIPHPTQAEDRKPICPPGRGFKAHLKSSSLKNKNLILRKGSKT
jgi:hypothetical protein